MLEWGVSFDLPGDARAKKKEGPSDFATTTRRRLRLSKVTSKQCPQKLNKRRTPARLHHYRPPCCNLAARTKKRGPYNDDQQFSKQARVVFLCNYRPHCGSCHFGTLSGDQPLLLVLLWHPTDRARVVRTRGPQGRSLHEAGHCVRLNA